MAARLKNGSCKFRDISIEYPQLAFLSFLVVLQPVRAERIADSWMAAGSNRAVM
jgi:hypothetical protein